MDWRPLHILILVFSADFLLDHHGFNVKSIYMYSSRSAACSTLKSSVRPGACLPCLPICLSAYLPICLSAYLSVCLLCLSVCLSPLSPLSITSNEYNKNVPHCSRSNCNSCSKSRYTHFRPPFTDLRASPFKRTSSAAQHSECLSYHRLILHHQSIYSPLQLY